MDTTDSIPDINGQPVREVYHEHINDCCIKIYESLQKGVYAFTVQDVAGDNYHGTFSPMGNSLRTSASQLYNLYLSKLVEYKNQQVVAHELIIH